MPALTPPPLKIPEKLRGNGEERVFFHQLVHALYQIFFAVGGNAENSGVPTIDFRIQGDLGAGLADTVTLTGDTDTPTADPGWATSSTVNMTAPDGYLRLYVGTQAVVVPYWNT